MRIDVGFHRHNRVLTIFAVRDFFHPRQMSLKIKVSTEIQWRLGLLRPLNFVPAWPVLAVILRYKKESSHTSTRCPA